MPVCESRGSAVKTVINVGANDGAYALELAQSGCKVVAFEPQPLCAAQIGWAIAHGEFKNSIQLFNAFVSPRPMSTPVPTDQCIGTAQFTRDGVNYKFDWMKGHE